MSGTTIYAADGGFIVERCEPENDGICHKALFFGPDAELHAWLFEALIYRGISPHYHAAGSGDDIDTCSRCGLDIRNPVHSSRAQEGGR